MNGFKTPDDRIEAVELYRDLLLSNLTECIKLYLKGMLVLLDGTNASKASFIGTLQALTEVLEGGINDLTSDLIIDLQRSDEYEQSEILHRTTEPEGPH